jgi:hypothetical protein
MHFVVHAYKLLFLILCSEEGEVGDTITGKYAVMPADLPPQVHVVVYGPNQEQMYSRSDSNQGKFNLKSSVYGEFRVCFDNTGSSMRTVSLLFATQYVTRDYEQAAKKDNLKPIETELLRIQDAVDSIYHDLTYLQKREEEMRSTNGEELSWFWINLDFRIHQCSSAMVERCVYFCCCWAFFGSDLLSQRVLCFQEVILKTQLLSVH